MAERTTVNFVEEILFTYANKEKNKKRAFDPIGGL